MANLLDSQVLSDRARAESAARTAQSSPTFGFEVDQNFESRALGVNPPDPSSLSSSTISNVDTFEYTMILDDISWVGVGQKVWVNDSSNTSRNVVKSIDESNNKIYFQFSFAYQWDTNAVVTERIIGIRYETNNAAQRVERDKDNSSWNNIGEQISTTKSQRFEKISNFQGFNSPITNQKIDVLGFFTVGDGGGGEFYWDVNEDKLNHNGGTIIDPDHSASVGDLDWYSSENTGNGCWKRNIKDNITPEHFGAKGDDNNDDYNAIQAALNFCSNNKYYLYLPNKYYTSKGLTLPDSLRGFKMFGRGSSRLGQSSGIRSDSLDDWLFSLGDTGDGAQDNSFEDFYLKGTSDMNGGFRISACRGTWFKNILCDGFSKDGAKAFYFNPRSSTSGNAVYVNKFINCKVTDCNIAVSVIKEGDQTAFPFSNTMDNFEFEQPAGNNPIMYDFSDARGWTITGGKCAGTGTSYSGDLTVFKIYNNTYGISVFGGHYEQVNKFIDQYGDSTISLYGIENSFEGGGIFAEDSDKVSIMKSDGLLLGSKNIFSQRISGLNTFGSSLATINRATIKNLIPNGDFSIFPPSQGDTVSGISSGRYIAGVWSLIGGDFNGNKETSEVLFGNNSLRLSDQSSFVRNAEYKIINWQKYIGKRLTASVYVKTDPNDPSPRFRIQILVDNTTIGDSQEDDTPSEWGLISAKTNDVIPDSATGVRVVITPCGGNGDNTGACYVDGVTLISGVGGRSFDDVIQQQNDLQEDLDVWEYMTLSGQNNLSSSPINNLNPNYIGEEVVYDGSVYKAIGLNIDDWVTIGASKNNQGNVSIEYDVEGYDGSYHGVIQSILNNNAFYRWEDNDGVKFEIDRNGVVKAVENDYEVISNGSGIIIKSPDGSKWRLTPDDSGNSVWTKI